MPVARPTADQGAAPIKQVFVMYMVNQKDKGGRLKSGLYYKARPNQKIRIGAFSCIYILFPLIYAKGSVTF